MARDREASATGHFRLNPKEVSIFNIPKILFSSKNLEERKFVDAEGDFKLAETTTSESVADHFRRRKKKPSRLTGYKYYKDSFLFGFILLITIMIQSFLLFIDSPLYYFGSLLRKFLNLLSKARIAFYHLLGKEFVPDNELNFNKIKQEGGNKNSAALSVMACYASYQKLDDIKTALPHAPKMEFVDYYGFSQARGKATTDAFILLDRSNNEEDTYVLAFRGTEAFNAHEWYIDFDISWYKFGDQIGSIHGGFLEALGLEKQKGYMGQWPKEEEEEEKGIAYYRLRDKLKRALRNNNSNNEKAKEARIIITGHSLGGALAIIFTATLIMHNEIELLKRIDKVYTFGQPRVGDAAFAKYMEDKLKEHDIGYYRSVYSYDIVPRLPFDFKEQMYKHFGSCIYYKHHSEFEAVEEVPMENYFSLLMAIPKRLNAAFQVIRSLIEGDDGAEVASNMVGIIFPGIAAHTVKRYVKAYQITPFDPSRDLKKAQ